MKSNFLIHVALLLVISIVGCGPPPIQDGEVSSKEFVPAHTETDLVPEYDFDMNFTGFTEEEYDVPDKWYVTFKRMDESTNKWRYRTLQIPKNTFDSYEVGDWISFK